MVEGEGVRFGSSLRTILTLENRCKQMSVRANEKKKCNDSSVLRSKGSSYSWDNLIRLGRAKKIAGEAER